MKFFVMSDIHGDYLAMMQAIRESGYDKKNPDHQIVVIGDYFGRATTDKGAYGIWKYLTSKTHKNKPICLKGNHEESFVSKIFKRGYITGLDEANGETATVLSFFRYIKGADKKEYNELMQPVRAYLKEHPIVTTSVVTTSEESSDNDYLKEMVCAVNLLGEGKKLVKWCDSLPYYFETKNYVFTHGWLPYRVNRDTNNLSDPGEMVYKYKELDKYSDAQWHRWTWVKTPDNYDEHCWHFPEGWKKWIVVGHWHAFAFGPRANFFNSDYWMKSDIKPEDYNYVVDEEHKVIFCDHCTAYGHKINMLVIEDELLDE